MRNTDLDKAIAAMRPRIMGFAMKLTNYNEETAKELVQTTLLRALEKEELFERGTNLFAWMCAILKNTYFRNRSHKQIEKNYENYERYVGSRGIMPANQEVSLMLKEALEIVKKNPKHINRAIEYGLSGDRYSEIAERHNVREGTIKSSVHRGRQ